MLSHSNAIETEVKIKIYRKKGYEYANFEKYYYVGPNPDEVNFLEASTYNPDRSNDNSDVSNPKNDKPSKATQPKNSTLYMPMAV